MNQAHNLAATTAPSGASATTPPAATGPLPGARAALTLLLMINLFNYVDRQVLAAVETDIRQEFFGRDEAGALLNPASQFWLDLVPTPEFWTGMLGTAFLLTYMFASPVFGYLGDRMSRWWLIALGIVIWTAASGASGLAVTFTLMFLTRCCVGFGEAVYGPVAPSVISDLFPVSVRGKVMAWFYAAIPVGSALGYALGGQVASMHALGGPGHAWRWAFYLVVPPGLVLALLCLFMREPPRGQADAAVAGKPPGLHWEDYRVLLHTPSYVLCTLGMTAMTFALGGMAFWMKAYLKEYRRIEEIGGLDPVTFFGILVTVMGLIATLAGGIAGDRLKKRYPGSYFLVSGLAMFGGFLFITIFLYSPFPLAWVFLALAVFCLFFNTGPTNTILANVTHPAIRSSAFALNILIIHLFGDAISPPVIGLIKGWTNFDVAFIVVSITVLIGGALWLYGMRYLERDTELAPQRLSV